MKYCSTRGGVKDLSFEEALFSGFLADGGISMPQHVPQVDTTTLLSWASLSYPELVKQIIPLFISQDEIPASDLSVIIDKAFVGFSIPEVVRVARLSEDLNILEMFHGKTLAFKDLAMSCVGQFIEYFLNKREKHVTILIGTSGDTGSAAIESVRGLKWVDIIVMLPRGRCSQIQELQMTTVLDHNVHVYRVDGTSDDMDVTMKSCFLDVDFVKRHQLISINSINWSRILIQIAHYFYSYLQMSPDCSETVEIIIPTGALGNTCAGAIAHEMGLPVKLVCAVNRNDIVARTMQTGDFSTSTVFQTIAPAMDIQVPYNMERLLFLFTKGNTDTVTSLMAQVELTGKVQLPKDILDKIKEVIVGSAVVKDEEIRATMQEVWNRDQYLLCPHTATAVHYHLTHREDVRRMCLATASADKFEEAVKSAGLQPQPSPAIQALLTKRTRYSDLEKHQNWEEVMRQCIETITQRVAQTS